MPRPRKKSIPTLNIITFCDIITVSMVAMFMVLIIVTDQAMKTPVIRPLPLALATTNAPVYFECRSNQVFFIDRAELGEARDQTLKALEARGVQQENLLRAAMETEIGNRFYKFENSFLMMGIMALVPRAGAQGVALAELETPGNDFLQKLDWMNPYAHYAVFLVRDDSFPVYRAVRTLTSRRGLLSGWEYLGHNEVITFEGMFGRVKAE